MQQGPKCKNNLASIVHLMYWFLKYEDPKVSCEKYVKQEKCWNFKEETFINISCLVECNQVENQKLSA